MKAVRLSRRRRWPLLIGVAAAAGCASCDRRTVDYAEARAVVNRRCIECHSEQPTNRAFPIAPKGVILDTAMQMKQYAPRIEARVAVERTMPLANMSGMTDEERRVLGRWVEAGAKVPAQGPAVPPGAVLVNVNMTGFDPALIAAKAGQPLKLAFFRPNDLKCTREVVFPGLGIRKELPPGQIVLVEIPPAKTGPIAFECGMKMLKGQVIVR